MKKNNSNNKLILWIIISIAAGFIIGGIFPSTSTSFEILGDIFLNLLMMIVIPLVMLSIIVGITNLGNISSIGSIGKKTIIYYFITTCLSVVIGIIMVNIINPGKNIKTTEEYTSLSYRIKKSKIIIDSQLKRNHYSDQYKVTLMDQNITGSIQSIKNKTIHIKKWSNNKQLKSSGIGIRIHIGLANRIQNKSKKTIASTLKEVIIGNKKTGKEGIVPRNIFNAMQRLEILPLIFFSLLFGAALSAIGDKGKRAIEFFSILNDAVMKIVDWIMIIAPIGIFGLIAARIGKAGGFSNFLPELYAVGKYSFTVVAGLSIHAFITLPLILYFVGKKNPFTFIKGISKALLNAFSTASSSATLPISMECVERENNISQETAGFVLPIGATINMDGTALYEAVAAIFISQVYGIELSMTHQIIIFITATLAAIGAAGIPEAGLVTMVIVLKAVGLPLEGIGIILTIDWLLDRFRTTVNVWGDCAGAGVIETLESKA